MRRAIVVVSSSKQLENHLCAAVRRVVKKLRLDDTYDVIPPLVINPEDIVVLDIPYRGRFSPTLQKYEDFLYGDSDLTQLGLLQDMYYCRELKKKKCIIIGLLPDPREAKRYNSERMAMPLLKSELDYFVRKGLFDSLDLQHQFSGIIKKISHTNPVHRW